MKNSKEYYNSIAEDYDKQSLSRINYLNAVDDLIIADRKHSSIKSYLDIGSGNGRRSLKLFKALDIKKITLIDNSSNMLNAVSNFDDIDVYTDSILNFEADKKFDFITCLWNVIGHFPSKDAMHLLFKKVDSLLEDQGVFIFDVNNRYNATYYGTKNVADNIQKDIEKDEHVGWFTLKSEQVETKVYIHSPFDIISYLNNTNLIVDHTFYVDYKTGMLKDTFLEGQLVYKLRKDGN